MTEKSQPTDLMAELQKLCDQALITLRDYPNLSTAGREVLEKLVAKTRETQAKLDQVALNPSSFLLKSDLSYIQATIPLALQGTLAEEQSYLLLVTLSTMSVILQTLILARTRKTRKVKYAS